jgi:N6-adenosine-specific RNA methylase IME4
MKPHPAASLFPLLEGEEFDRLVADIKDHGQREPCWVYKGLLLDGRNRWAACEKLGIEPKTREFHGDETGALSLAISLNVKRRHLTPGQRDMIGAAIEPMFAKLLAKRKSEGGKLAGKGRPKQVEANPPQPNRGPQARDLAAQAVGGSPRGIQRAKELIEKSPAVAEGVRSGKVTISKAISEIKLDAVRKKLEAVSSREVQKPSSEYDVVVIDPPWPMKKMARTNRPNQVGFGYPTMSEAEIAALELPCADDCHVWIWTTHRFLPMTFRLLDAWSLEYSCTFVWHKPGGPQAFGLPQFNCEFVVYARKGSPVFLDTKAFPVCFEAPRSGDSVKPDEFYDVVRRVTGGRRIDMFSRRMIEGFDGWGNESEDVGETGA